MHAKVVLSCLLLALPVSAQVSSTLSTSDSQAVILANQAMLALTGGTAITDVTLNATATSTVGPDQRSGTATLLAKAGGEARIDLNLSNGNRSEVRNASSGTPSADWSGTNSVIHATTRIASSSLMVALLRPTPTTPMDIGCKR